MSEQPHSENAKRITREVELREKRMLKARRTKMQSVWMGLGFFGLIGWSIVVPTLLGAGIGRWLDATYSGERSWTLTLLVAGLSLGCLNAGHWIIKEQRHIKSEQETTDD